jgi:hypothetical protein
MLKANPDQVSPELRRMYANNDARSTEKCVDFLRELALKKRTHYVSRGMDLDGKHDFEEAKFEIWAPEEDTSDYYGRFEKEFLGALETAGGPGGKKKMAPVEPPSGVDGSAFYRLLDFRSLGFADSLLTIDKAKNDTSVVFSLQWRGWRLLFCGDAQIRSWKTMNREGVLKPVHFLKVSHHGSHNGTPDGDILDAILPEDPPDDRHRRAVISTWEDTYAGIPHAPTNQKLEARCALRSIVDSKQKPYIDHYFTG